MVTLHSNIFFSSTSPAENPSTGCLQRSEPIDQNEKMSNQEEKTDDTILNFCGVPLSCFWRRRLACDAIG